MAFPAGATAIGNELYVFRNTELKTRTDAVIFAHGRKCEPDFSTLSTVNFYIQDEALFNFVKGTVLGSFERLTAKQVKPREVYHPDCSEKVPNYMLKKGAGEHISNVNARIYYSELKTIAENGWCDVISVRNHGRSQISLQDVIAVTKYDSYHCFFCRAMSTGKDTQGLKAAQAVNGTTINYK